MKVKLLDLRPQYQFIRDDLLKGIQNVCDAQSFILGENVRKLEEEIADYCNARYAVGVASGSDAILLSLMAIGVGPGDRVITIPYTFFATVSSIVRLGATPIFIDIEPETYNIDPNGLEHHIRKISNRKSHLSTLKAIIPVHLFGQCADMEPILSIARRYGLRVVEDAAQAIGAEYKGKKAGSMGDAGCLSFYPSKNLGGFGDGGMVLVQSKELEERMKVLRVHGSKSKYYHKYVGINSRLDEIQAAILRIKLKYLAKWEKRRIANARRYNQLFKESGLLGTVSIPRVYPHNLSVFNQYVVRVERRDALRTHLAKLGIGTEIYYPVPLHLQRCFKGLGYKRGDFPVSEKAARETIALPIYPELTEVEQRYVVSKIGKFYT
ncbi:MAG: DegT/DnrJ/EryC1/StrS family aminotransferase [Thermodesulfobacteriota bacterium]